MSKFKRYHSTRTVKRMLQHWNKSKIGPFRQSLSNSQPSGILKKDTARGAANTTDGKAEQTLTGPVSASNDN